MSPRYSPQDSPCYLGTTCRYHSASEAELLRCDRWDCLHAYASHLYGDCDWCPCEEFLHPDYDNDLENRVRHHEALP